MKCGLKPVYKHAASSGAGNETRLNFSAAYPNTTTLKHNFSHSSYANLGGALLKCRLVKLSLQWEQGPRLILKKRKCPGRILYVRTQMCTCVCTHTHRHTCLIFSRLSWILVFSHCQYWEHSHNIKSNIVCFSLRDMKSKQGKNSATAWYHYLSPLTEGCIADWWIAVFHSGFTLTWMVQK